QALETIEPGFTKKAIQGNEGFFAKGLGEILTNSTPESFAKKVQALETIEPGFTKKAIQGNEGFFAKGLGEILTNSTPESFAKKVEILNGIDSEFTKKAIQGNEKLFAEGLSRALIISTPENFAKKVEILNGIDSEFTKKAIQGNEKLFAIGLGKAFDSTPENFAKKVEILNGIDSDLVKKAIIGQEKLFAEGLNKGLNYSTQDFAEKVKVLETIQPGFATILIKLNELNSKKIPELEEMKDAIANITFASSNPVESINKIIAIFELSNIPPYVKKFLVFKHLFQIESGIEIKTNHSSIRTHDLLFHSPVLDKLWKNKDFNRLYNLVYRDIAKNAILSGERSTLDFAQNIASIEREMSHLNVDQTPNKPELDAKLNQLYYQIYSLHSQGVQGQRLNRLNQFMPGKDFANLAVEQKAEHLKKLVGANGNMFEQLTNIYLKPLGLNSFDAVTQIHEQTLNQANLRNKLNSEQPQLLFSGDSFIKGVGSGYFKQIMDGGSNAGELLGGTRATAVDFVTPLDIDLVRKDLSSEDGKRETFGYSYMGHDLILGIKNRGQFKFTENSNLGLKQDGSLYASGRSEALKNIKTEFQGNDPSIFAKDYGVWQDKYEVFQAAADFLDHYCIRTGIASTEIDFMIFDPKDKSRFENLKFNLAKKDLYVPIYNKNQELIFTYKDWQQYKKIFAGTEFSKSDLEINPNEQQLPNKMKLNLLEIEGQRNNPKIKEHLHSVKTEIQDTIHQALSKSDIKLRNGNEIEIYGADILDTGSTARHTNKADSFDFDFAVLLDNRNFVEKKQQLLEDLQKSFQADKIDLHGDTLRMYGVDLQGKKIDIDISMISKLAADNIVSSDQTTQQKLENIEATYGQGTAEQVRQQIVLAKTVMSQYNCYKRTYSGETEPSGIGGIGVENWILSNKGSFYEACKSIRDTAFKQGQQLSLEDFKSQYKVFNPGTNLRYIDSDFKEKTSNFIQALNEKGYENLLQMADEVVGHSGE
ncbi:MAG: hypothetical protein WCK98_04980, partial [bacterium]